MFFPTFIARALPWLRPTIFKAKCLRMVSINSEYLNLSMVEPAPENLAPWLLYSTVQPEVNFGDPQKMAFFMGD